MPGILPIRLASFRLKVLLLVNCRAPWCRQLGECDAVNRWAELRKGEGAAQWYFSRNLKLTAQGGERRGEERSSEKISNSFSMFTMP